MSTARRYTSIVVVVALVVVSCSQSSGDGADCDDVVDELVLATQHFLGELGGRTSEEAPSISTVEWWVHEYADLHLQRTKLFVSIDDNVTEAELDTLASDIEQIAGVQTARAVDQEAALADTRVLFANQPEILEQVAATPEMVPASLRVAVAPESESAVTRELQARSEVTEIIEDPVSIEDLMNGVAVLGLPPPAFDKPMKRAASQGCTEGVLLAEMRERNEELISQGSAGDAFIASVKSR